MILGGQCISMNLYMMRLIIVLALVACCVCNPNARRELKSATTPLFPAIFTFGDSFLDAGNNNYLPRSLAKANTVPNGIDFPTHNATGRFSNGKTLVDLIGEQLWESRGGPGAHWLSSWLHYLNYIRTNLLLLTRIGRNQLYI